MRPSLHSLTWLAPAVLAAAAITALALVAEYTHLATPAFRDVQMPAAKIYRAHMLWTISFAGFVAAALWSCVIATVVSWPRLTFSSRVAAASGSAILTTFAALRGYVNRNNTDDLFGPLEAAQEVRIHHVTWFGNSLATLAGCLLVVACCSLIVKPSVTLSIAELRKVMASSRLLFFSAAALLIVGAGEIYTLVIWSFHVATTVLPKLDVGAAQHVVDTVTLTSSIVYSGLLVCLFAPVTVVQTVWIEKAWRAATTTGTAESNRNEWLSKNGLDSVSATAAQIITVAAPWLLKIASTVSQKLSA
jgi:hypothetical protein